MARFTSSGRLPRDPVSGSDSTGKYIATGSKSRHEGQNVSTAPEFAPGTVSKILWHFTGGPPWNPRTERQGTAPKPAGDAYRNLQSILKSRELRLGSYTETVKVVVPQQTVLNKETRKFEVRKNVPAAIRSLPVCCLSDIPAAHLGYHAYRYGKFAVGFHREAAVRHGFNPVCRFVRPRASSRHSLY